jgi:hypothetical protein
MLTALLLDQDVPQQSPYAFFGYAKGCSNMHFRQDAFKIQPPAFKPAQSDTNDMHRRSGLSHFVLRRLQHSVKSADNASALLDL